MELRLRASRGVYWADASITPNAMTFNDNFDQHSRWRRDFSSDLQALSDWLRDRDLLDAAVADQVENLRQRVKEDKVMVAFVAEFSRGKSELINAVFFAGYGRRIMPASAGRTTMCPTELGYDAEEPASLRLLPVETRLQARSLVDWRHQPDAWETVPLNVADADSLAASLGRVAEVRRVTPDEAAALGFWQTEGGVDKSMVGPDGLIEVPRWRHALINIAHPLLKQGLVILDTPGLNAIGAEPELTVSLLPQAHSIIFILGADTGVTQSDLRIWREHILPTVANPAGKLVVLNKIDTLWDELSTPEAVQNQIHRQCESSAGILAIPPSRVIAVSAQKGLVAKIHGDGELLDASKLPVLEKVLVHDIIGQRRQLLQQAVSQGVSALVVRVGQITQSRSRDLTEQIQELEGLRGKNGAVIRHMRLRIEQEQHDFESGSSRIQAVRSVHIKLLHDMYAAVGQPQVRQEVAQLMGRLQEPGLKLGVRRTYAHTFDRLRALLTKAAAISLEIGNMLQASFVQLNTELGFSLQAPPPPDLSQQLQELAQVEQSHVQYLGLGQTFKLANPDFCDRLGRALLSRLRIVYESAATELELWNKSAAAQLDGQLRDRRNNFARRVEAVTRIQEAAGGLNDRVAELTLQLDVLTNTRQALESLTRGMTQLNAPDALVGEQNALPSEGLGAA